MRRTVLITGCSSGLGQATAGHFARNGWNVAATMRRPEAGVELAGADGVLVARLDVQDPGSIADAVDIALARFGRIDVLVNNAGFGLFGLFEATPPAKVREQFEVNLFGAMNVTRAVLPHFRGRGSGLIINVSSGAGVYGLPMLSLYCASKFALEGFSEALAYELASQNIVVKIVEPGGIGGTGFGDRSAAEAVQAPRLAGYDRFVAGAEALFIRLRAERRASRDDAAAVIYRAATDGTDRLRYVATDDIKPLVAARRETSEDDYIALMRARFAPPPQG